MLPFLTTSYTMEEEFFRLIQDPEFCRKAEEESMLREITIMKLTSTQNAYGAAKIKSDTIEMARLQKEIDAIQVELKQLH